MRRAPHGGFSLIEVMAALAVLALAAAALLPLWAGHLAALREARLAAQGWLRLQSGLTDRAVQAPDWSLALQHDPDWIWTDRPDWFAPGATAGWRAWTLEPRPAGAGPRLTLYVRETRPPARP